MKSFHQQPVCIYVDNSNIFIGGQETAKMKGEDPHLLRIDFSNFLSLVTGGTGEFNELVWAGSGNHEHEEIFNGIRGKGVDLQLIPRSESGENETVDQAMQLSMYRHARKYQSSPGTMVLCTGDGKGYHEEKGFLYDVQGFIEDGWTLALYSWNSICHKGLKAFAKKHGSFVALERYYDKITFIQNGRHAKGINSKARGGEVQLTTKPMRSQRSTKKKT